MKRVLVPVILAAVLPLFTASPSFAMKGIDAARACNANPDCHVIYNPDGSIDILLGDDWIDCPKPQEECTVVRVSSRPKGNFSDAPTSLSQDSDDAADASEDRGNDDSGNSGVRDRGDFVGSSSDTFTDSGTGGGGLIR